MKKVLTLVLALVFVLALAAPAMAFTSDTTAANPTPFTLKVYLVEYQSEDLFIGWIGLPPADRGYAKNETVAAVVEFKVPKGEKLDANWLPLEISSKGAVLNIEKNRQAGNATVYELKSSGLATVTDGFTLKGDNKLTRTTLNAATTEFDQSAGANKTVKWLVFAYVTGDDASITAKFAESAVPSIGADFVLNGVTYKVTKTDGESYKIEVKSGTYSGSEITLNINSDNKTTGMAIMPNFIGGSGQNVIVTHGSPFVAYNATAPGVYLEPDSGPYVAAKKVYDNVVVKVFGFNYDLIGAFLRDKHFTDLVSNKTLVAKVDIKPWTAYVKVPDNVVVNPPKTGAAASILGFVMVALAGASAVALKKR